MLGQNHCLVTLLAVIAICWIPQNGYAKMLQCGYVLCNSSYQYCDTRLDDCVHCDIPCPQTTKPTWHCARLCPDYKSNHFKMSTTQEPVIEMTTSIVVDQVKGQSNGRQDGPLQPVPNKSSLHKIGIAAVIVPLIIVADSWYFYILVSV